MPLARDLPPAAVLDQYRRHLSKGRASLAQLSGGLLELRSSGASVWTADGREFLNCGAYGVLLHGATHPAIVDAVVEQVRRHPISTRVLLDPLAGQAAEDLVAVCPPGLTKVHFAGSGTEATETAIKMARSRGKTRLVTTIGGYHGKTMGALSVTSRDVFQAPFRPLLPDVTHVRYGDADAMAEALAEGAGRSCVIVEPIQAENGVIVPPDGYLTEIRELCQRYESYLVLDEIFCGLGRLGRWWGADRDGVTPDIMLVGKALSGGVVPVSAAVATEDAYRAFDADPFLHTSTFAAAPIAMAAAIAAIATITSDGLVERAADLGRQIKAGLVAAVARRCPQLITEVRGEGLLIGVECVDAAVVGELMLALLDRSVIVNHSLNRTSVLRLTPPAVLRTEQVTHLLDAFDDALAEVAQRFPAATDATATALSGPTRHPKPGR